MGLCVCEIMKSLFLFFVVLCNNFGVEKCNLYSRQKAKVFFLFFYLHVAVGKF